MTKIGNALHRFHGILLAEGLLLMVLLGFIVLSTSEVMANKDDIFRPHPLTNASPAEVGQIALDITKDQFPSVSGAPEPDAILTRSVTKNDLPDLGLGSIDFASIEEPPLMLVIVKGNFTFGDHPGLSQTKTSEHFQYIGYVFDLWAGVPTRTMASPDGAIFRTALNDPTLPMIPTPAISQPASTYIKHLHYGETAPTVVVPLGGPSSK